MKGRTVGPLSAYRDGKNRHDLDPRIFAAEPRAAACQGCAVSEAARPPQSDLSFNGSAGRGPWVDRTYFRRAFPERSRRISRNHVRSAVGGVYRQHLQDGDPLQRTLFFAIAEPGGGADPARYAPA